MSASEQPSTVPASGTALTPDKARERLRFHSMRHDDVDHPNGERGFLGSLRPYGGLRIENLHDVMASLRALAPDFANSRVDREVLTDLWGICHFARAWGVGRGSMLHRNDLITPEDTERLDAWVDAISYAVFCMLDGADAACAFEAYHLLPGAPPPVDALFREP